MKTAVLLTLLSLIISFTHVQSQTIQTDTLTLFFEIDRFNIEEDQQQKVIDYLSKTDRLVSIQIVAYADYLGSVPYNHILCEKRAKASLSILKHSFFENRPFSFTKQIINKGRQEGINRSEVKGNSQNRKVEFVLRYIPKDRVEKVKTEPLITEQKVELPKKPIEVESIDKAFSDLNVGDKFLIKNLLFIGGQHFLQKESKPQLFELLKALAENTNIYIEIQGHVCCTDIDADGLDLHTGLNNLSIARAEYIYSFLIDKGISVRRLTYNGFGGSQKLFPEENNEYEKQMNRRVEIMITQK